MRFFHILHEIYIYKQKGSAYINTWVETKLARNTISEEK